MLWGKLAIVFIAFAVPVLNALVLIWLCKVQTRREERYGIHGDVPALPAEAKAAGGKSRGEGASRAARTLRTGDVRTHHGSVSNR
jgi:hypothetical protein